MYLDGALGSLEPYQTQRDVVGPVSCWQMLGKRLPTAGARPCILRMLESLAVYLPSIPLIDVLLIVRSSLPCLRVVL